MNLPKVKFTNILLSKEVDWIHGFLFRNEWGWGKYIIKKHPRIKKVFSLKTESGQVKFLREYIVKFRKDNKQAIENNKTKYRKEWQKVERVFLKTLSEIMEIEWPKNRKTINAMMSINPICPRFLNNWSFSIFYNHKRISHAMEIIMHECCHFLYFEKWKKLYPKMAHKKFESPYPEWHLSEIIAPIILNDARIQKLLKQKAVFYSEHQKLKIERKVVPKYFTDLYRIILEKECDFGKFLETSYQIVKKNKELFKI